VKFRLNGVTGSQKTKPVERTLFPAASIFVFLGVKIRKPVLPTGETGFLGYEGEI